MFNYLIINNKSNKIIRKTILQIHCQTLQKLLEACNIGLIY